MKKTITSIITVLIASLMLFSVPPARGQTTTLSLSEVTTCPVSDVAVTLHVENLFNVGAISLYIGYDTTVLEYQGHSSVHPQFMSILSNPVTSPATQINIIWSNPMGATIQSGTLMVLNFTYKGGNSNLTFNPGCELSNVNFAPIPFTGENGAVLLGPPYITDNPIPVIVTEGAAASFSVTADGASTYQWQEFDGESWQNLQEDPVYQNVNGSQLIIAETALEMDSLYFRCYVTAQDFCEAYSDSAMLTVLPEFTALLMLSNISSCPNQQVAVPLKGYALEDVIEFAFYISYLPAIAQFTGLENVHPLIEGATAQTFTSPIPHIKVFWSAAIGVNIPDGNLFDLMFDYTQSPAPLVFMDQSFVLSAGLFNYNLSLINGQITTLEHPLVISHPADTTVIPGTIAQFSVTAENTSSYRWYESQDNGQTWNALQNIAPYAGTLTPLLSIAPVSSSFDDYLYKCKLTGPFCETFSNPAKLTVDTTSSVEYLPLTGKFALKSYTSRLGETEFSFNIPVSGTLSIRFYDLTGRLLHQSELHGVQPGIFTLTETFHQAPGIRIMQSILQGNHNGIFYLNKKLLIR